MFLHTMTIYSISEKKNIFTSPSVASCKNILERTERCILKVEFQALELYD